MSFSPRYFVALTLISALVLISLVATRAGFARLSPSSAVRNAAASELLNQKPDQARGFEPCTERGNDDKRRDDGRGRDDDGCIEGSSSGIAKGDFNGDGIADLVVGVPLEDIGNLQDAGAVNVIYGSPDGLSATAGPGDQLITQESTGMGQSEAGDKFGAAVASGRFNGDISRDVVDCSWIHAVSVSL